MFPLEVQTCDIDMIVAAKPQSLVHSHLLSGLVAAYSFRPSCTFHVIMDRVSNDVLISVLGYGGVALYSRINALNIACNIATSDYTSDNIVDAVLEFPLDPHTVCTFLNYDISQSRAERLVGIARQKGDLHFMDENEFRKLIVLQLGLAHLRMSRPFPHNVMGQDIFELLLRSVSRRLTLDHSTSVRVLQRLTLQIDLYERPLALDVGDRISRMQAEWRLLVVDSVCLQTVFMVLYQTELLVCRLSF